MHTEPSGLAYQIAMQIWATLSSDEGRQRTFEAHPEEVLDFFAAEIECVLRSPHFPAKPVTSTRKRQPITDGWARARLERFPAHIQLYYDRRRSCGDRPSEAFNAAARLAYESATHD